LWRWPHTTRGFRCRSGLPSRRPSFCYLVRARSVFLTTDFNLFPAPYPSALSRGEPLIASAFGFVSPHRPCQCHCRPLVHHRVDSSIIASGARIVSKWGIAWILLLWVQSWLWVFPMAMVQRPCTVQASNCFTAKVDQQKLSNRHIVPQRVPARKCCEMSQPLHRLFLDPRLHARTISHLNYHVRIIYKIRTSRNTCMIGHTESTL
jgi:hypothetical protein